MTTPNPYASYLASATPERVPWDYGGMQASQLGLPTQSFDWLEATGELGAPQEWGYSENGTPNSVTAYERPQGYGYAYDNQNGIRWNIDDNGYVIPGTNISLRHNGDFGNGVLALIGAMAGYGFSGAGAGAGASTSSAGATAATTTAAEQAAAAAARNALINGTMSELRGGDFMDGARAGALSGLAAPIGAAAAGAATSAGLGSTTATVLGGAAQGGAGALLSGAARGDPPNWDAVLQGAASGGAGAGVNEALGGGFVGSLGGRTASNLARGQDLDDAFIGALRGTATNPNSYRSSASSGAESSSMDLPETDTWDYGGYSGGGDSLPEVDDWYYGDPAAETGGYDWGSREGGNYPDETSTQGPGGSPWNSSEPTWYEGLLDAGGGALSSIGGWLNQLWQGTPQSRNQANALLGLLGMYQAYRANSGSNGAAGGGARLSPQQLQGMLPGNNANATWNAAQQAASQRFFTSPLTQVSQPTGADALQRYGVDPMAPRYADGGEVLPARRPTDPVPGTRGPIRRPNGASPAQEAALRAIYQQGAAVPPRSASSAPMPGSGAPRVTVERLRRAGEYAAGGEVMGEGPLSMLGAQHEGPGFVMSGEGGGQDDRVDAALSPGEYVFDADVVSALGDGSNDEGARRLDEMRERIRRHKRAAPPSEIPPKARAPEAYLP